MGRVVEQLKAKFLENSRSVPGGMYEAENFWFEINPQSSFDMFNGTVWFEPHIAAAMYSWFVRGDRNDSSICEYLPLYAKTKNKIMPYHNSNYGYYAFIKGYLYKCVEEIEKDLNTRRATFLINNNTVAFSDDHTDKLCTNSISFRVRRNRLNMTVHMRSNDFLTMLPYDMFQFCMFYGIVYSRLFKTFHGLEVGKYFHFADSMHTSKINYVGLKTYTFNQVPRMRIPDMQAENFSEQILNYCNNLVKHHEDRKNS